MQKITFLSKHVHGPCTQPNLMSHLKNIYFQICIGLCLKCSIAKMLPWHILVLFFELEKCTYTFYRFLWKKVKNNIFISILFYYFWPPLIIQVIYGLRESRLLTWNLSKISIQEGGRPLSCLTPWFSMGGTYPSIPSSIIRHWDGGELKKLLGIH